jgi:FtsP/CotA-like multicopper oxidase with cupredoxin domain
VGRASLLGGILLLVACERAEESAPGQPSGWDAAVHLVEATDQNPDPSVLEVRLRAQPSGQSIVEAGATEVYAYDGLLPGPLLRARAGDRLIVHFENDLPEPTTIHWHGLRIAAAMDGAPGHSQPEIPPGASFEYAFDLPDAGLFWYHPHVRSSAQVASGLYGPLVVEAPDEPPVDTAVLVLSDIALHEDGTLVDHGQVGDLSALFGREGTHVLVNGRVLPELRVRPGLPLRLRLVGAAISRYWQLELPGHTFTRIGGDAGFLAEPETLETLLLLPGQRADVVVVPRGAPGQVLPLRWLPYDRGYGSFEFRDPVDVLRLVLEGGEAGVAPPPWPRREVAALDGAGATEVDISLTMDQGDNGTVVLGIDGVPFDEGIPVPAFVGETQRWTVRNEMAWAHPFHLHGFFFQALDPGGDVVPEWRDTVDVPVDGSARYLVRYDDRPGMWMFHCHILDHADAGMMGLVHLSE